MRNMDDEIAGSKRLALVPAFPPDGYSVEYRLRRQDGMYRYSPLLHS
jgi:hypothetical protein